MKTKRNILLGFMAPILLTGSGLVTDADAGVKVKATVRTPGVVVRVGHPAYRPCRVHRVRPVPVRRYVHYTVTRHDWLVAGRLASVTGVSSRQIVRLRGVGHTWFEIGRWLRLPRPVIRAAMDHYSWKRFLRERRRFGRHGLDDYGRRGVGLIDLEYNSDAVYKDEIYDGGDFDYEIDDD